MGGDDRLHLLAIPLLLSVRHAHGLEESCRRGETGAFLQQLFKGVRLAPALVWYSCLGGSKVTQDLSLL